MNLIGIILSILGIASVAGVVVAYFVASAGKANRELLESNIEAYKDAIDLKDKEINYLRGQVDSKDRTIDKLSSKK